MCGIFGYVALDEGQEPNISLLKAMADACVSRGSDSHGISQYVGDTQYSFRSPGSFADNLDALEWCKGTKCVIGHTRFGTSGTWEDNKNNQPIAWGSQMFKSKGKQVQVGPMAMVHNGTLSNYNSLVARWKASSRLKGDCDSEIIGYIVRQGLGAGKTFEESVEMFEDEFAGGTKWVSPLALMFLYGNDLHMYRNGNPTHWYEGEGGLYFCSLPFKSGSIGETTDKEYTTFKILPDTRKNSELTCPKIQPMVYAKARHRKYATVSKPIRIYTTELVKMQAPSVAVDEFFGEGILASYDGSSRDWKVNIQAEVKDADVPVLQ